MRRDHYSLPPTYLQNNFAIMSGEYPVLTDTTSLNGPITKDEIRSAMATARKGNALGCDDIPLEVLQSEQCSRYLLTLFNCCFLRVVFQKLGLEE